VVPVVGVATNANGVRAVMAKLADAGNMVARTDLDVVKTSAEACQTASSSVHHT